MDAKTWDEHQERNRILHIFKVSPPKIFIYYKDGGSSFTEKFGKCHLNQVIKVNTSSNRTGRYSVQLRGCNEKNVTLAILCSKFITWVSSWENIRLPEIEVHSIKCVAYVLQKMWRSWKSRRLRNCSRLRGMTLGMPCDPYQDISGTIVGCLSEECTGVNCSILATFVDIWSCLK